MSDADGEFFWNKGKGSGLGGMLDHEGRKRTAESRTIEHPDGRRETIHTVTEHDYRTSYFSARDTEQYRIGAESYTRLREPIAAQNTPLHHLTHMKNEMMAEIMGKLQPSENRGNVLQLKAQK